MILNFHERPIFPLSVDNKNEVAIFFYHSPIHELSTNIVKEVNSTCRWLLWSTKIVNNSCVLPEFFLLSYSLSEVWKKLKLYININIEYLYQIGLACQYHIPKGLKRYLENYEPQNIFEFEILL